MGQLEISLLVIKKQTYKANLSALLMGRVELARLPLSMKCHDLFCDLFLNRELFHHRRFQLREVAIREEFRIKKIRNRAEKLTSGGRTGFSGAIN